MNRMHPTNQAARRRALVSGLILGISCTVAVGEQPNPPSLTTLTIEPQSHRPRLSVGGTVSAQKTVALAAQAPGRVETIAGREGDAFKRGDLLVKVDEETLRAQLQAARAQEAAAGAALRNAGVQLNREIASPGLSSNAPGGMGLPSMMDQMFVNPMQNMMGMRRPGVERGADVYARQSSVEQARSSLYQAQSQIKEIEARMRDTQSLAPFDGVIVKKFVEVGDTVQPGQPLLSFSDTVLLKIDVDVPARLRPVLREGMDVSVEIGALNNPLQARLVRIFPVADPTRHTIRTELTLPPDSGASPGMYAEVMIPDPSAAAEDVIAVPHTAVVDRAGLTQVFVVNRAGRAVPRLVRIGESLGSGDVEVLAGLRGGEVIVVTPTPGLRSGTPVQTTTP